MPPVSDTDVAFMHSFVSDTEIITELGAQSVIQRCHWGGGGLWAVATPPQGKRNETEKKKKKEKKKRKKKERKKERKKGTMNNVSSSFLWEWPGFPLFFQRWVELGLWFIYRWKGGAIAVILVYNKFWWRKRFFSYGFFSIFSPSG